MAIEDSPAFILESSASESANHQVILVLDGGPGRPEGFWNAIVRAVHHLNVLPVTVRYPESSDEVHPLDVATAIVRMLDLTRSRSPQIRTVILAGSGAGCIALQIVLSITSSTVTDLILIDPDPMEFGQESEQDKGPLGRQETFQTPTTLILHGSSAASTSNLVRLQAQEHDLKRFPHCRQVIAGRSSRCIVSERPDVVIETIQRHLALRSPNSESPDT